MTAKAKAIQALVAVSISAVAYTVYTNSSGKEKKAETTRVETRPVLKAEEKDKNAKATSPGSVDHQPNVPGYSNPEEHVR